MFCIEIICLSLEVIFERDDHVQINDTDEENIHTYLILDWNLKLIIPYF